MFISRVPSKGTPLIFLGVASLFAATAVPPDGRASAALFTVSRKPRLSIKALLFAMSEPFDATLRYDPSLCSRLYEPISAPLFR
ncbi:hypothetical protein E3N34_23260 [Escherichia coli]|nr:hypothetical protein [Escherichia coli]PHU81459.1 hypothetical protein CSW70_01105 [Shigella sonnei]TXR45204.1 hypothetical protein FV438_05290 [Escherichia coli]